MEASSELILFLHIPKTAGTTVNRFFQTQFDTDQMVSQGGLTHLREFTNRSSTAKQRHRVVSGHMQFGMHRSFNGPSTYVTLLRDPIDRLVSFYYFALTYPDMYLHRVAARMSLQDFLTSRQSVELDNHQVRLLAGRMSAPIGTLTSTDLRHAIENLQTRFAVVGVQDNVRGFLNAVAERFGFSCTRVPRQNVTPKRPTLAAVSRAAKHAIAQCNALDMQLYQFVKDHLAPASHWQRTGKVMQAWAQATLFFLPSLWPDYAKAASPAA